MLPAGYDVNKMFLVDEGGGVFSLYFRPIQSEHRLDRHLQAHDQLIRATWHTALVGIEHRSGGGAYVVPRPTHKDRMPGLAAARHAGRL